MGDKGKGIEIWEDKTERNDRGPKSDENVTVMQSKSNLSPSLPGLVQS